MENGEEWLRDMKNKINTSNINPIVIPEGEKERIGEIIKKLFEKITVECFIQRMNNMNLHIQKAKSQVGYIKIKPHLDKF